MKKIKIFIVSLPLIIMVYWFINRNNNLVNNSVDDTIVKVDCKLNNKIYSYEIIYDDNNNLYKIKPNSSLLIEIQKSNEEELENILNNIFETKGGTCSASNNSIINLDLEYQ